MADASPLARISMTIPPDALRRADRLAKQAGRSRSWVLAEAVRRLELSEEAPAPSPSRAPASIPPRLDASRRAQLRADLALTPLERVLAAERTAREVPRRRFAALYAGFDRFEDYLEWKRLEATGLL
ncbi:MAG: ribbon-helix-helix protein, CopG family [Gemmatimonadaceae bacterium]|nr:ribbon-helix-helix protein, CopG family [Gemmatimonadaceae bacterium]MCW5826742.1 ribbon-helix-helix protein, CopG family [Gemmatimonadaceae bacterium]